MNRDELLTFLRAQPWAVEASVCDGGAPQAAVIGVAVTESLELVFDTFSTSRKAVNLRANPHIALVLGWDEGQTVQYEGVADEPTGDDLERLKRLYLQRFPDGREREALADICYFRVTPTWIRYSDFRPTPPALVVFQEDALTELVGEARVAKGATSAPAADRVTANLPARDLAETESF